MNFMESFGQHYPEQFETTLDSISLAVSCAFNSFGTLLAVGCNDGRIVIWDFISRNISKIIAAHVHPISSLQWTQNGQKLLSSSTDNHVCKWDVLTDTCEAKYFFPTPVMKAQMNPLNENQILVNPLNHLPVLLNGQGGHECLPMNTEGDLNVIVVFDKPGKYIYTGNYRGRIAVFDVSSLKVVASFRIVIGNNTTTAIKNIAFIPKSEDVVISTADRYIRIYNTKKIIAAGLCITLEPQQKFQDLFNKSAWKKFCFSGDGEYICAANTKHVLYIWEKAGGVLVKTLNITKDDMLLDVDWHPQRPIIASVSSGLVSIWSQYQTENWQAYDPNFREIDENVVYDESETEFDEDDADKSVAVNDGGKNCAEVTCDIEVIDNHDNLTHLPISPEFEEEHSNGNDGKRKRI